MKKLLILFILTVPLFTFCMKKRPLRKAQSDSSLLSSQSLSIKQSSISLFPKYKALQKKPALASVLLVFGKNFRFDPDVPKRANELYLIADKVNPAKRDLLEDRDEFLYMDKIIEDKKKNREKSIRVEPKVISSRKAKDINSSKDLSI